MKIKKIIKPVLISALMGVASTNVLAQDVVDICPNAESRAAIHGILEGLLKDAQAQSNGGFGFHMWATIVNRDGVVCAVASSGDERGDQWPGSRVISAQKANTANAFSLPRFALSTANLHQATQNGGSLFGLQFSNPVNTAVAYLGPSSAYGSASDPLVGEKVGGVNVFGGGLGLYDSGGSLLGAVGVSGDSSCADHNIAWRIRNAAGLDYVPAGPSPDGNDQLIYNDPETGVSSTGFGHPDCGNGEPVVTATLPPTSSTNSGDSGAAATE